MTGKKNICIVTPDIVGPVRNGGIGTHCHFLAQELQGAGHAVTVFYTGPFERHGPEYFRTRFRERSISFAALGDAPAPLAPLRTEWFTEHSYRVYQYLRAHTFDVIHFQDWQGNGFHTLQAKRTTGEFHDTRLIVTMHSSTEWIREGMRQWLIFPIEGAKLQWCERYCCQHADLLVSPSEHMFAWATSRNWSLAANRQVANYCIDCRRIEPVVDFNAARLAYFGRLEERKGLRIFCEGLRLLPDATRSKIDRIYFIGKAGETSRGAAGPFIAETLASLGIRWEIHSEYDSFQARRFLKQAGAVAFIPSLLDNLPYTVIECCCDGIPVFASNAGGIPELLPSEQRFAPTVRGVADAMDHVLCGKARAFRTFYDPERSRLAWFSLTLDNNSDTPGDTGTRRPRAQCSRPRDEPLVSICVPHFNYGKYLPGMLESLRASSYSNFEVIVVDDGSTDDGSRAVFDRLSAAPPDPNLRFLRKANGGIGETRNYAAGHANGAFLLFMDADNLATPLMIEKFVRGIRLSSADVLCCHFKAFDVNDHPTEESPPQFIYIPLGPALEVGWACNVFGDANFIVKRDVFERLGGFCTERDSSWEDYEFLARLVLQGYHHEVIPEALFWYRLTPEGFSRNTSQYLNHRRVLRTYAAHQAPNMRWLFESVLPSFLHETQPTTLQPATTALQPAPTTPPPATTIGTRIGKRMEGMINRAVDRTFPPNSVRRERMFRFYQKIPGRL